MSRGARLLLALLVLDATVLAVLELFYLPLRLAPRFGGAPLPFSILLAAVSTPLLVRGAGQLSSRLAVAGAPLAAWVLTVLLIGVAGPGGDVLLPGDARSLVFLAAGVLPAGVVLGRLAGGDVPAGGGAAGAAAGGTGARDAEGGDGV